MSDTPKDTELRELIDNNLALYHESHCIEDTLRSSTPCTCGAVDEALAFISTHSLQERQSELEMFKKLPIQVISKEVAAHISRRYKDLEASKEK